MSDADPRPHDPPSTPEEIDARCQDLGSATLNVSGPAWTWINHYMRDIPVLLDRLKPNPRCTVSPHPMALADPHDDEGHCLVCAELELSPETIALLDAAAAVNWPHTEGALAEAVRAWQDAACPDRVTTLAPSED